jgi:uncharacterized protein YjiS (DUF1127 family)
MRWRDAMPTINADFHTLKPTDKRHASFWANFYEHLKLQRAHRRSQNYLAQFDDAKLDDIGVRHTIRVIRSVEN